MIKKLISIIKIINILIVFVLSLTFIYDRYSNSEVYTSNYMINNGFNNKNNLESINYINEIYIYIPSINLNKKVVKAYDDFSNLNNNLVYYKSLNVNDKNIIFGHSGLGFGTYFNRIDELKDNDLLYIRVGNINYTYVFKDKYIINETDTYILNNETNSNKLLLITCNKSVKNKRLVVEFKLKCTKSVEN